MVSERIEIFPINGSFWKRSARDAGAAVLLISEDLDEVMALADRIGVMSAGRIIGEFAQPADRQAIGQAMVNHV